jgi:hypothetical protein
MSRYIQIYDKNYGIEGVHSIYFAASYWGRLDVHDLAIKIFEGDMEMVYGSALKTFLKL